MLIKHQLCCFLVMIFSFTLAEPLISTTSIWINPVFRSVLANTKSVRMALQASGPLSVVEFAPLSENCKIMESYRFRESREYTLAEAKIKPTKFGLSWVSPLGVSINLLSDQTFPLELKTLPHALTQAMYDGIYQTRRKRLILIDKGILHWRGRRYPLEIELASSEEETKDLVNIVGEKGLFGRPIRWATTWTAPTLNFYPINKPKPFLTLSKLPEYKIIWPATTTINESEQHIQRYYDRIAHLLEAEEFDLLADYIGYKNLTILHKNWTERFKSAHGMKWRMKTAFTHPIISSILELKDQPVAVDDQGVHFGDSVILRPTEAGFELILNP